MPVPGVMKPGRMNSSAKDRQAGTAMVTYQGL